MRQYTPNLRDFFGASSSKVDLLVRLHHTECDCDPQLAVDAQLPEGCRKIHCNRDMLSTMSSYWNMPSHTAFKKPRVGIDSASASAPMACIDVHMPDSTVTPLEAEIAFRAFHGFTLAEIMEKTPGALSIPTAVAVAPPTILPGGVTLPVNGGKGTGTTPGPYAEFGSFFFFFFFFETGFDTEKTLTLPKLPRRSAPGVLLCSQLFRRQPLPAQGHRGNDC